MKLLTAVLMLTVTLLLAIVSQAQTPPTVLSARAVHDDGGNGGRPTSQYVDAVFSQNMDVASVLNPGNYSISGATITNVSLFTDNHTNSYSTMVILHLAGPLTSPFTLNVSTNVQDASQVPVAANTSVSGTVDRLRSVNIGGPSTPVIVPGTTFCTGPGSYVINASGNDLWGTSDSFRFIYEPKTNDFDVVVRVTTLLGADQWTKAGLHVREVIDPEAGGSRMMTLACTPAFTNVILDGTVGINDITGAWRSAPDAAAYNPNNSNGSGYYVGDGTIIPDYPNQWLRLTRNLTATNDIFRGYVSRDGTNWTLFALYDAANDDNNAYPAAFSNVVYVGICATAHISPFAVTNDYLMTARLADYANYVAVSNPPPPFPSSAIRNEYNVGGTNNLIVLQAVDYNLASPSVDGTHNWVFTSAPMNLSPTDLDTNFSASGVMEVQPNWGQSSGNLGPVGCGLSFAVNFTSTGTYRVWMRGIGNSAPGPSNNDSVQVGLDGKITTLIGNSGWAQGQGFYWDGPANVLGGSSSTIVITNSGLHVINVWMREDGFDFDKLVLTSSPDYVPTGLGPAESPLTDANIYVAISKSGTSVTVTWPAGTTLQSATDVLGPWADVPGARSPYTVVPTGPQGYYRIRE